MRSDSGIATSSGERETAFRRRRRKCGWKGLAALSSGHERNPPADEINRLGEGRHDLSSPGDRLARNWPKLSCGFSFTGGRMVVGERFFSLADHRSVILT